MNVITGRLGKSKVYLPKILEDSKKRPTIVIDDMNIPIREYFDEHWKEDYEPMLITLSARGIYSEDDMMLRDIADIRRTQTAINRDNYDLKPSVYLLRNIERDQLMKYAQVANFQDIKLTVLMQPSATHHKSPVEIRRM